MKVELGILASNCNYKKYPLNHCESISLGRYRERGYVNFAANYFFHSYSAHWQQLMTFWKNSTSVDCFAPLHKESVFITLNFVFCRLWPNESKSRISHICFLWSSLCFNNLLKMKQIYKSPKHSSSTQKQGVWYKISLLYRKMSFPVCRCLISPKR